MSESKMFSKKGQRKISSFVGQELLYDYMKGQLDEERKKAVEEYISLNRDAKADMHKIQNGLNYTEKLSQTQVSEALKERVSLPTSYLQVLLQKIRFEDWPPALRMGLEATVVALGITILAILIPWHKVMDLKIGSKDVVLAELEKNFASKPVAETETTVKEQLVFPDELTPTTTLIPTAKNAVVPPVTSTTLPVTTTSTMPAKTVQTKSTPTVLPIQPTAPVESTTASSTAAAPVSESKKAVGELYRGVVDVTNREAVTTKLVEKVLQLGGRKAGQVDLGWSKNGESSYFHFTIPAKEYDQMLAAFNEYGKLKIQKEKHERVMPDGIMRVIITVNEK